MNSMYARATCGPSAPEAAFAACATRSSGPRQSGSGLPWAMSTIGVGTVDKLRVETPFVHGTTARGLCLGGTNRYWGRKASLLVFHGASVPGTTVPSTSRAKMVPVGPADSR